MPTTIALAVAAIAALHFAWNIKSRLGTGMTGFDTTWYHAPFAAGFAQSGDTWGLHMIAPQFLAWFYPANGELFHALGMLAFDRDLLSPLLNLGWFAGCLLACWCLGRPFGVAPWSLALGAAALSVPALHDQAGEARNDIVGAFFLLAAVAIALNAWGKGTATDGPDAAERGDGGTAAPGAGALIVCGLAAGMAAGAKLNFLLPAAVLIAGLAALAAATDGDGARRPAGNLSGRSPWAAAARALAIAAAAALLGGGYWYLRNLVHAGNPLPWVDSIGPISLPAPDQALGGREAHSVAGYLLDGAVWSDWLLPGFRDGLTILWPLLLVGALAALVGAVSSFRPTGPTKSTRPPAARRGPLAVAGAVGLAAAFAWLLAPTSASGPEGMPRGFESGLRYLAPALVLGLALLPTTPALRRLATRTSRTSSQLVSDSGTNCELREEEAPERGEGTGRRLPPRRAAAALAAALVVAVAVAIGYPVQRHYLEKRYADPAFAAPGLNAAFAWARDVSGARIATTSTRQYPLFGADLSNRVEFVGESRPHGGFEAPSTCPAWRRLLNEGNYDYVVASLDRLGQKQTYPPSARWTAGPWAEPILRQPPTVVYRLRGKLDPTSCPH